MSRLVMVVLVAAVFASAIEVVLCQHESRKLFVQIQALDRARDKLNEQWGRLQLEQSTWATADRIETLARTKLGMHEPDVNDTILLKK